MCEIAFGWVNPLPSSDPGTYYFGFDNPHPSHDAGFFTVGWIDDAWEVQTWEDWSKPVGMGEGPIHILTPEPTSLALLGLGGLFLRKRKA